MPVGAIADTSGSSHPLLRAALQHVENFGRGSLQAAKDLGGHLLSADRAIGNAIVHPVDTFNALRSAPEANAREGLRGVNDNIPGANYLVSKLPYGPPSYSAEDQAAAIPGARDVGGVIGLPAGNLVGGIAAKGIETAAPAVASALRGVGAKAVDNQVARAGELLEEKVSKRTRAGLDTGPVERAIVENPELRQAAGNDKLVAQVTAKMKASAGDAAGRIYDLKPAGVPLDAPISQMDKRIAELEKGTQTEAETAVELKAIRDSFEKRLSARADEGLSATAAPAREIRAEQSDFQTKAYAKADPKDKAATAIVHANDEAQRIVGDALLTHVTGLDYKAAQSAAMADPQGVAAQLLKANDTISAANRIEAGIRDRAGRAPVAHGVPAVLAHVAKHAVLPAVVGSTHGIGHGIVAAALQEGALPAYRAAAAGTNALAATVAPKLANVADRVGAAAGSAAEGSANLARHPLDVLRAHVAAGNPKAIALTQALNASRSLGRPGSPSVGSVSAGTLATQ